MTDNEVPSLITSVIKHNVKGETYIVVTYPRCFTFKIRFTSVRMVQPP